jgi:UDP-glucose 4-epimerase
MTTTRVLVTGGAGFIGSHTAERFAREGYQVRILDDLSSGDRANCDPAWDLQVGDVRDPAAVEQAARDAEVVVHLAAFISVPESFERFADCYRSNVWGSYAVLQQRLGQLCGAPGLPAPGRAQAGLRQLVGGVRGAARRAQA